VLAHAVVWDRTQPIHAAGALARARHCSGAAAIATNCHRFHYVKTSFAKPEVHNSSQRNRRRVKPRQVRQKVLRSGEKGWKALRGVGCLPHAVGSSDTSSDLMTGHKMKPPEVKMKAYYTLEVQKGAKLAQLSLAKFA